MKKPLINELSKTEIETLHNDGWLIYCPSCKEYHWASEQHFPYYNVKHCEKCRKESK